MAKFNPVLGSPPTLEWVPIDDLRIDETYQRSTDTESGRSLIRSIAEHWNWDRCGVLEVARRDDGARYVVDGQHRRAGAKLRGDIGHLPCLVRSSAGVASEADLFVKLNKHRRPLNAVEIFHANVAAGDPLAIDVARVITDARLTIAPHSNYTVWKPKQLYCVPGILSLYRQHGRVTVSNALVAIAEAWPDEVLRFAGTMIRPIAAIYATDGREEGFDPDVFIERLAVNSQQQWVRRASERTLATNENLYKALVALLRDAYHSAAAA